MALLLVLILPSPVTAAVQGELVVKNGQPLLRVWGTHEERGYATGVLVGEEAVELFRAYVSELIGWSPYATLHAVYPTYFRIPQELVDESEGLIAGARAVGVEVHVPELGRELDVVDLAIMSSIPDLGALGLKLGVFCSSVTAWNSALAPESGFDGELVHARNLEWSDTTEHELAASTLVVVSIPAEADEQPWVAVGFPGMWGTLSAMNSVGVGLTLNMGDHKVAPSFPCDPIMMVARQAVERADANQDGSCDLADISDLTSGASRASSYILTSFMPPAGAGTDPCALAVETNAVSFALRGASDDPVVAPDFLLATNHHRVTYPPASCERYEILQNAVVARRPVDTQGVYDIARLVSQGVWTLQSMILRPHPRDLSVTHIQKDGTQSPLVSFSWAEMMDPPLPTPRVVGPCFIHPGETAVLDAGGGYTSYLWSTGESTRMIEVSPDANSSYMVSVTDMEGWQGSSSFTLKVWSTDFLLLDCFETGGLSGWSGVSR